MPREQYDPNTYHGEASPLARRKDGGLMCAYTLSINTCFAVKRWPEPRVWASLVRERLGLDTVQFSLDLVELFLDREVLKRQARDVRRACDEYGLHLQSCFTGLAAYNRNMLLSPDNDLRRGALEWYRRALEFAALLGCKTAGGHLGSMTVSEFADPDCYRRRIERLIADVATLAHDAGEFGLSGLLVEPMPVARELTSTMDNTARLLREINEVAELPVCLTLDLGHACAYGNSAADRDPYAWLRRFGKESPVVHLQQTDGVHDCHFSFTPEHNTAGIIDAGSAIEALGDGGANDTVLTLEVLHPHEYPEEKVLDELAQSVAYWKGALGKT